MLWVAPEASSAYAGKGYPIGHGAAAFRHKPNSAANGVLLNHDSPGLREVVITFDRLT